MNLYVSGAMCDHVSVIGEGRSVRQRAKAGGSRFTEVMTPLIDTGVACTLCRID